MGVVIETIHPKKNYICKKKYQWEKSPRARNKSRRQA